jgi:hypothetical protein
MPDRGSDSPRLVASASRRSAPLPGRWTSRPRGQVLVQGPVHRVPCVEVAACSLDPRFLQPVSPSHVPRRRGSLA